MTATQRLRNTYMGMKNKDGGEKQGRGLMDGQARTREASERRGDQRHLTIAPQEKSKALAQIVPAVEADSRSWQSRLWPPAAGLSSSSSPPPPASRAWGLWPWPPSALCQHPAQVLQRDLKACSSPHSSSIPPPAPLGMTHDLRLQAPQAGAVQKIQGVPSTASYCAGTGPLLISLQTQPSSCSCWGWGGFCIYRHPASKSQSV